MYTCVVCACVPKIKSLPLPILSLLYTFIPDAPCPVCLCPVKRKKVVARQNKSLSLEWALCLLLSSATMWLLSTGKRHLCLLLLGKWEEKALCLKRKEEKCLLPAMEVENSNSMSMASICLFSLKRKDRTMPLPACLGTAAGMAGMAMVGGYELSYLLSSLSKKKKEGRMRHGKQA